MPTQIIITSLAAIASAGELMSVLLHPSQPPWLLHRSCRLLAVLATCEHASHLLIGSDIKTEFLTNPMHVPTDPRLFKYLSPHPEPSISGVRNQDTDKLAYLEQLCTLLIDPGHQCQEVCRLSNNYLLRGLSHYFLNRQMI